MTLKELQKHYYIYKRDNEYRICSLTEHGRTSHKYLCSALKNGNKMNVIGYEPTSKIEVFSEQVQDYLSNLKYNSEYFNPDYVKGYAEELFAHDYMRQLGFKNTDKEDYKLDRENVYGGKYLSLHLSFNGLSAMSFRGKELSETIKVNLWLNNSSWISTETPRTFEGIKKGVDGLLKPLLLTESLKLFEMSEQMGCNEVDLKQTSMSGLNMTTSDFKATLRQRLEEILNTL